MQSWAVVLGALGGCWATADGMALVQSVKWGFLPGWGTTRSPKPGVTTTTAVSPLPTLISYVSSVTTS